MVSVSKLDLTVVPALWEAEAGGWQVQGIIGLQECFGGKNYYGYMKIGQVCQKLLMRLAWSFCHVHKPRYLGSVTLKLKQPQDLLQGCAQQTPGRTPKPDPVTLRWGLRMSAWPNFQGDKTADAVAAQGTVLWDPLLIVMQKFIFTTTDSTVFMWLFLSPSDKLYASYHAACLHGVLDSDLIHVNLEPGSVALFRNGIFAEPK